MDDIVNTYVEGWQLGLKAIAIYRDGSKRSAPSMSRRPRTWAAGDSEATIAEAEAVLNDKAALECRVADLERNSTPAQGESRSARAPPHAETRVSP